MYTFNDVQAFLFLALAVYVGSLLTVLTLVTYGAWETRRKMRRDRELRRRD